MQAPPGLDRERPRVLYDHTYGPRATREDGATRSPPGAARNIARARGTRPVWLALTLVPAVIGVVAIDLVLTRLFDVSETAAAVVALAVVGWIYVPIRERVLARFTTPATPGAFDASRLIAAAWEQGQVAERRRIRRDLHDDLGASIIRIVHEAPDERTAELAHAAMRDLRDVLTALHDTPAPCRDVLDDLEAELRARAVARGRELHWSVEIAAHHVLSARARANLARVLRESMTNALKHGIGPIRYTFAIDARELRATACNAIAAPETEEVETGFGLGNITSRMAELGGTASYVRDHGRFTLAIRLPWAAEA